MRFYFNSSIIIVWYYYRNKTFVLESLNSTVYWVEFCKKKISFFFFGTYYGQKGLHWPGTQYIQSSRVWWISLCAVLETTIMDSSVMCIILLFRSGQLKGSMALCKHTLHQGSNPKAVKFVSTASNLCHYTKEHMCLMIQSKTSEKCQKVSLLFRVKEILLLFVWSNNHLFEVHNWYYIWDFS